MEPHRLTPGGSLLAAVRQHWPELPESVVGLRVTVEISPAIVPDPAVAFVALTEAWVALLPQVEGELIARGLSRLANAAEKRHELELHLDILLEQLVEAARAPSVAEPAPPPIPQERPWWVRTRKYLKSLMF